MYYRDHSEASVSLVMFCRRQSLMTSKERKVIKELLLAIEHIKLPMMLKQEQAQTYNELMFAVAKVKTLLDGED